MFIHLKYKNITFLCIVLLSLYGSFNFGLKTKFVSLLDYLFPESPYYFCNSVLKWHKHHMIGGNPYNENMRRKEVPLIG